MFIILAGTCKASSEAGADRLCACHVMGAGQGGGGGGGGLPLIASQATADEGCTAMSTFLQLCSCQSSDRTALCPGDELGARCSLSADTAGFWERPCSAEADKRPCSAEADNFLHHLPGVGGCCHQI